ncbi:Por secretion system C-terminal sorting domain-containing protein [Hymenobacter gelipurpurascens]|uniref:Por secretion system C-terminal sorting domain-containing protein n=1 Tax=Hymenobacter gelipurpurascens TaxID=89968 RepID=A0A212TR07_9BACT|nr:T9SS type A sorting domain-containing protein [Hymenobacter gelipurpurascens]SNC68435.1 Por secretion system C-terminal sorting domain-containing protein [Hymenobacter gelipurpurascens]
MPSTLQFSTSTLCQQPKRLWPLLAAALGLLGSQPIAAQQTLRKQLAPVPAQTSIRLPYAAPASHVVAALARPTVAHGVQASISSTATGGNWSDPTTWAGGIVPSAADEVTIVAGATVTVDVAAACASLTIANTASLLTSTTTAYQLQVAGSVTNNGTLDLSNSATVGTDLRFTGAGSASFTGTGTTDLQTVSLAKSVRDDVVDMNLPTLSVKGSATTGDGFLITRVGTPLADDMTGTLKISGSATISNKVVGGAAGYTLPATGGLWLSNANFTVLGQTGSPTINGLLRISAGTYNVGTASGNSLGFGTGALYTQEGGTVNIAGRLNTANAITFTMSGGDLNVVTVGNASASSFSFSLSNNTAANTQTISGGTITLVQPNTNAAIVAADYYVLGSMTATGGTLRIGTGATTAPATGQATFRLAGNAPGLLIDGTTTAKTALLAAQLVVRGNTVVQATSTLDLNGFLLLQAGPTFTNNGTFTANTSASGSTIPGSRLYFQSSAAQTLNGTGTFTSPIRQITFENTGGGVTIAAPIAATSVAMFTGNVLGANNLTIGGGNPVFNSIQYGVTGSTTTAGNFDVAPAFNLGSGALQLIYAPETAPRTTGFEIPASRAVDVITMSNPAGVVVAGGNIQVAGVSNASVLLSNGIITTSPSNTLIIGAGAGDFPVGSALSYVKGPLGITVNSTTPVSRTFAVGDATGWRPVVLMGISTTAAQTFTATVVGGATGGTVSGALSSLNPTRYVRIQNTANLPASARVQLSYGTNDIAGGTATTVVAQAATATGVFVSRGGALATVPTTGVVSTQDLTPGNDFFVLANTEGGVLASSAASVCGGTNAGVITLTGNQGTVVNYQADSGTGFQDVAGTNTGATYAFANLTATTTFRAVILTADNRTVYSAPVTVTATPTPSAAFSYATATYCLGAANPTPTITGAAGGTFSSSATGLVIDPATGVINLATSTAGTYTITYTVAGTCASTATATITINATPARPTVTVVYNGLTTTLTSSAATGNQWYLNGTAIAGATNQTYVVNAAAQYGSYTVATTASGCASQPSQPLVVTSAVKPLAGTSLTLFPTPTTDGHLTLELKGYTKAVTLSIYNAVGQQVRSLTVPAGRQLQPLDLSQLPGGIYILRAQTAGGLDVRRIVKE